MKHLFFFAAALLFSLAARAQELKEIKLNAPDKSRGSSVMQALDVRASAREMEETALSLQDLSDLLWAAYGTNRPDGRRTAPTAKNAQDIDLYVCLPAGAYLYDARNNLLKPIASGDLRPALASGQAFINKVPVVLLIVSDYSRFRLNDDEKARLWAAMDGGIVSQNINIFCAAVGLSTVPRAYMDQEQIKKALKLTDTQMPVLNNPVGYPKRAAVRPPV
ncbi:MAG: SagB/ThcOx family dehydrogenase [Odoribacteraceae bacterium]|jgi:SagB-type dehydrogenase family enzyme|nr:SagB/ThcOx family dehydrogenase [Odoribacteraceae bacterium]